MIDEDKTAEIVISNSSGNLHSNLNPVDLSATVSKHLNRRKTDPKPTPAAAISKPNWASVLHQEWHEDWTLRVLAVLAIIALSLLVL